MWPPPLGPQMGVLMTPQNAVLAVAHTCGHPHWGLRWSSVWGHEAPYLVWRTHVAIPSGVLNGAPYGATKRRIGYGGRMWHSHWGLVWNSVWGQET
eukprot:2634136-Pyramimonas_sp.AAC.1